MHSPLLNPMAVIGAGSWGTALAIQCARAGHPTRLWGRDAALVESMRVARRNARYLPDAEFPPSLEPVADLREALAGVRDALVAVPSLSIQRRSSTRFNLPVPSVRGSEAAGQTRARRTR